MKTERNVILKETNKENVRKKGKERKCNKGVKEFLFTKKKQLCDPRKLSILKHRHVFKNSV